jgi:hypothetical protein
MAKDAAGLVANTGVQRRRPHDRRSRPWTAGAATLSMMRDGRSFEGVYGNMLFVRELPETLLQSFHFRYHVGHPAYPVGRIAAFENPDIVIRLRALRVPQSAERRVTSNALQAYLRREHVRRRFVGGLCRRSGQADTRTASIQHGLRREFDAQHQAGHHKCKSQKILTGFHATPRFRILCANNGRLDLSIRVTPP